MGRFTYYSAKQESSTIDYAISSYVLFQKLSHFIVKPESYLSDHCQIVTWFEINKQNKDNSQWENDLFKLPKSFKFEKTNKNVFFFFGRIGIIQNTNKNHVFSSAIISSD